jgi:hypothetical protein
MPAAETPAAASSPATPASGRSAVRRDGRATRAGAGPAGGTAPCASVPSAAVPMDSDVGTRGGTLAACGPGAAASEVICAGAGAVAAPSCASPASDTAARARRVAAAAVPRNGRGARMWSMTVTTRFAASGARKRTNTGQVEGPCRTRRYLPPSWPVPWMNLTRLGFRRAEMRCAAFDRALPGSYMAASLGRFEQDGSMRGDLSGKEAIPGFIRRVRLLAAGCSHARESARRAAFSRFG